MAIVIVYIDFSSLSLTIYNSTFSCQIKKRNRQSKRHWQQHYNGKCKKNVTLRQTKLSHISTKKKQQNLSKRREKLKNHTSFRFFLLLIVSFSIFAFYTIYTQFQNVFTRYYSWKLSSIEEENCLLHIEYENYNRYLINTDFIRLCVWYLFFKLDFFVFLSSYFIWRNKISYCQCLWSNEYVFLKKFNFFFFCWFFKNIFSLKTQIRLIN